MVSDDGTGHNEHPPRPRLTFTLSVTGHRASRLTDLDILGERVRDVVDMLQHSVVNIDHGPWFTPEPANLRVMSALAEGADRIVADIAMAAGFNLDVVLPFAPDIYVEDFETPESRQAYAAFLAAAERTLVLPGVRDSSSRAYALAGEALVAQGTVLLAIWDGEPALGHGGTAEVVAHAIENGVPVIQVPIDPAEPVQLIWSSFARFATTTRDAALTAANDWHKVNVDAMLARLLLPPDDALERRDLNVFYRERERLYQWRIEYPMMLAITGTQKLARRVWQRSPYREATRGDWRAFRDAGAVLTRSNARALDSLEAAYSWADNLATHFAQALRSGHVVNFSVAALAVLVALVGLILPSAKVWLVIIELFLIVSVVLNTRAGHNGEWQRRWLDYRNLAERLRPMRSLKIFGVANPPRPPARKRSNSRRWLDWYVTAHWRAMGMPDGVIDSNQMHFLPHLVAEQELVSEIAYHRRNALRMRHLEHRLAQIGGYAFDATIVLCSIFPVAYLVMHGIQSEYTHLFVVLTAGLPAIGGATYALRTHGDYAGNAGRSTETADELDEIRAALLEPDVSLTRAGALTSAAARVMLVDLSEWRLTYEQRTLAIPG